MVQKKKVCVFVCRIGSNKANVVIKKNIGECFLLFKIWQDFPGGPVVKNLLSFTGDMGSIPGQGRYHMLWGN